MSIRTLGRRQFLVGTGGLTLGLPVLRSLCASEAAADEALNEKRFVAFATGHGGLDESAMYPDDALLTESQALFGEHSVRCGDLLRKVNGDRASVSGILTASADRLTDDIVTRMNVVRGLDIPFYIAHHSGGHLGNYSRNDGNGDDGKAVQGSPMPSIDQVMAWSSSFYGDAAGITERVMVLAPGRLSWVWSSAATHSGTIQEVSSQNNPLTMFRKIFVSEPSMEPSAPAPRPPIVDKVLGTYRSLRQGNAKLSKGDGQRLDEHMERLAELERRLAVNTSTPRRSCKDVQQPPSNYDSTPQAYYSAMNDVICAAFLCGTSRVAVLTISESDFVPYAGDWHQDVAHKHQDPEPQRLLQQANQQAFEYSVLDLVHKLNVEEAPGKNLLDSTLVQWSQESGAKTHDARSLPLVTFGGAGGTLRTGNYCDYRNLSSKGVMHSGYGGNTGLLYTQWLGMALRCMGVSASEYQNIQYNAPQGYGVSYRSQDYSKAQESGVVEKAGENLPFLAV